MKTIPVSVALGAAFMLAACAQTPENAGDRSAAAPVSAAYKDALAREYADLSLFEARRMYDRGTAERFASKATAASRHEPVLPEDPAQWNIEDEGRRAALREGRQRLMNAMHGGAAQAAPVPLARAQVQFDCWVEQAAEGWQSRHIAACRDGFMTAMARVEEAAQGTAADPVKRILLVPFGFNSAALTGRAPSVVEEAAETIRQSGADRVVVVGHTDKAGPDSYNRGLSRKRAEAVRESLIERGIPAEQIVVRAAGESRPILPTGDGVPDPDNRVVQIRIGDPATS